MNSYLKCLFVAAIIINLYSTAFALHCIVCTSEYDSNCNDPYNGYGGDHYYDGDHNYDCDTFQNEIEVPGPNYTTIKKLAYSTGCLKTKVLIEEYGVKKELLQRACVWNDPTDVAVRCREHHQRVTGRNFEELSCHICTNELCNSSISSGAFAATVVFCITLIRMMS